MRLFAASRRKTIEISDILKTETTSGQDKPEASADGDRSSGASLSLARDQQTALTLDLIESDLRTAAGSIGTSAENLRARVGEQLLLLSDIRSHSQALHSETRHADETAQQLSASVEQLVAASNEIDGQVRNSSRLAEEAREVADTANTGIQELKSAIDDIANVVRLISDVAKQTNLLALNATIEAARAGEAGRGFAVVANEVKALSVETQNATDEIVANIARLQTSAEGSIRAVDRIIGVIGEILPSFAAVAEAVGQQMETSRSVGETARETADFVRAVTEKVSTIAQATDSAERAGEAAGEASRSMLALGNSLSGRFTMMIRQTAIGDRRRDDRLPAELTGTLTQAGRSLPIKTLDLSTGGALLVPQEGEARATSGPATVELSGLGRTDLQVVAVTDLGMHCAFDRPDETFTARLAEQLARVRGELAPSIERAQDGAHGVIEAMEAAVSSGKLTLDALFDTDYQPISGTNPRQVSNRALTVLERILPPIQEDILTRAKGTGLVFCVAVDRNAYLPVHNAIYSQPQRPDDPAWNAANCRNRRIFDDRAGLSAARNTRPFLVQTYPRDMGNGTIIWMREIDAPITVAGRHWGGFRTAYKL